MIRIKIADPSTRRGIILDDVQSDMFLKELARTQGDIEPAGDHLQRVASDMTIRVVDDAAPVREYLIYGRSVLFDTQDKTMRQFYMGLLLQEWLSR
ncbi:hypothetical protein [Taklimakanibacter lacteus]|uniref:hypothetical protein n=1 Tax=Taklimakanibacter lacteus TaxID=2268456 RepID=UPI000E664D7E